MTTSRQRSIEIRVPASTANLGAGFDCLGLALQLYLTVRATVLSSPGARSTIRSRGESGSSLLPRSPEQNLILRAMRHAAEREGLSLPPVRLAVHNRIPLVAGLGSSAAAIVAGISLAFALQDRKLLPDLALRYAVEIEGHADNVGAALLGGLVVTCLRGDGSVAAIRKRWPAAIRIVTVTPAFTLKTADARAVLPKKVERADAIHNLQRSALLVAAMEEGRYDCLWDALEDRLHQPYRKSLVPGLSEALATPRSQGLLGVALSGSGPSVVALATERFEEIGESIAAHFRRNGLATDVRCLSVCDDGVSTLKKSSRSD